MLRAHEAVAEVLYPDRVRRSRRARCATSAAWCRSSPHDEDAALDVVRAHAAVHARRVAGRGGIADRAPGADDARVGRGLAAGSRPPPGAPVGRHRVARRPRRRPEARPRLPALNNTFAQIPRVRPIVCDRRSVRRRCSATESSRTCRSVITAAFGDRYGRVRRRIDRCPRRSTVQRRPLASNS